MELAANVLAEYLSMARTRKAKQVVKDKAPRQKCLHPECRNDAHIGKRGLCAGHYNQFDYDRECAAKGLTGKKAQAAMDEFDKRKVEAGEVLSARRGRKRKPVPQNKAS